MATDTLPLDQTPGAMAVRLERRMPDGGLLEFESAPAGFLSKNGQPRRNEWRRYFYTPAGFTKRYVLPSVTSVCGAVLSKEALIPWSEAAGIAGAVEAVRRGLITSETPSDEAVRIVRGARLGAEAARDEAADRGINVHAILEAYMSTGQVPNPAGHPETHRPFIQGLARWLVMARPEPVAVELLVCDPERGYAGRADLIARFGNRLTLVDLKTSPTAAVYDAAHLQVSLLRDAELRCGEHQIEDVLLVAVDGRGRYREMGCIAPRDVTGKALAYYAAMKGVTAESERQNRIAKEIQGT